MHILAVDDDPQWLRVIQHVLDNAGYDVTTAETGKEGLRLTRALSPDLLLLDRMLPDGDGVEVCRQIKADPVTAHIFVVMMSGRRMSPGDQISGLAGGADAYIVLPIDRRQLLAQVEAMLRIKQAEDRVAHLHRVLRAVKSVNQLIIREKNRDRLLQGICDLLIETRGFHHVWIALTSQAGELQRAVEAGLGDVAGSFLDRLRGGLMPGCGRVALAQTEVVVTPGSSNACSDCPAAATDGVWAGMTTRLTHADRAYGVLCGGVPVSLVADEEGQVLFREVAADIAFALHNIELAEARERAESALVRSEARLKAMFESSPDIVALTDLRGTLLDINRVTPGYTRDRLIGSSFADHLTASETKLFNDALDRAIATGVTQSCEVTVVDPQGQTVNWLNRIAPMGTKGEVTHLVINSTDVTDRRQIEDEMRQLLECTEHSRRVLLQTLEDGKRAEDALRASETRFRHAMEATTDGLFDWDIQTNEIYYSPGYFNMLGYDPHELPMTFETYERLLHPEDARRSALQLAEYLSAGQGDASIELRLRTKAGGWLWVLSRARVVEHDEQGRPLRLVGTNVNIDARKRAEAALRHEKELAQQYLNVAGVMLVALDCQQRVMGINPRGCETLGYPEEEIVGRDWFDSYVPRDQADAVRPVFEQAIAGDIQPVEYYENSVVTRDGGERIIAWHNSILHDDAGNIVGLLSSGEDITERKRDEAALQAYSERLEDMVEARTQDLREAQSQLVRREKLAVLGQLAGGLGHELRNPLGAIKNAAYLLNQVLENPGLDAREALAILDREVDVAAGIISSLLDYARVRPPNRCEMDLNDVVRQALARTRVPSAPPVEVVLDLDDRMPSILADRNQLAQVFDNIIRNGVQAMPAGGRMTVKSARRADPKDHREWVMVSITDTGTGIAEENLGRIFEPLFTTKTDGVGLGLALVKHLVEGHGGRVEAQSVAGAGSTFTIALPAGETSD